LTVILLNLAGCGVSKQSTDEFITVNVTANYPKKGLILQDFMDVEYIALETTDEFLTQGVVMDISKEIMVVRNQIQDVGIFLFLTEHPAKWLRKIN
jgi:hypothetical protein